MKIWNEYASEHSANLVMIGRFKTVHDAQEAKALLDRLTAQVAKEPEAYEADLVPKDWRFSDDMMALLKASNFYHVAPIELGQLICEFDVTLKGEKIILTTEEVEVSTFLKVLLHKGGRVETYSAHDYPKTGKEC